MSVGKVTGRGVKAAFTRSSTWGVPASVTRQLWLGETSGLDTVVGMVDDESFNQTFLLPGQVGDHGAVSKDLPMQLRYETVDTWLAAAMGSAAAPVVVSSQAASSLVAYTHQIDLATELTHFLTLAVDEQQHVLEVPTLKVSGYSVKVGANGRMMVDFSIVGAKTNYDSTVNTNSTVAGAVAPVVGTRLFRKDGVFRLNRQGAGALGSTDVYDKLTDVSFDAKQPLADGDFVFGQNYIIEPDNNGFPEFPLTVNFARMNTVTANSLARGLQAGESWKADWTFTGPYINSHTQYSLRWEFPALQLYSFEAPIVGANQAKPSATFRAKQASAAPSGMTVTAPFRLTVINTNSANLLA
jgi:hypothetical protein